MNRQDLARLIDLTCVRPDGMRQDVERLCAEAREYGFASAIVLPSWIPLAADLLTGSNVAVGSVVGFPFGGNRTAVKVVEARDLVEAGATAIDMVANIGAIRSGDWRAVAQDIGEVVRVVNPYDIEVKVIVECGFLTDAEKRAVAEIVANSGADFVKTGTGFQAGPATVEDVRLLCAAVDGACGVKAAGGIRTYEAAIAMLEAGAARIGASNGVAILASAPA